MTNRIFVPIRSGLMVMAVKMLIFQLKRLLFPLWLLFAILLANPIHAYSNNLPHTSIEQYSVNTSISQLEISVFSDHDAFLSNSGPYYLGWAILNEAAVIAKIKLVPAHNSWTRSLTRLKSGSLASVYGAIYTEERAKWAMFSLPLSSDSIHIFAHNTNASNVLADIDLVNSVVGVAKDSVQSHYAKQLGFQNIYDTADALTLFKMLRAQRIDYLIFSHSSAIIYCKNEQSPVAKVAFADDKQPTMKPISPSSHGHTSLLVHTKSRVDRDQSCLKKVGQPLVVNGIHVISRRDNLDTIKLIKKLDNAIQKMHVNKRIKSLYKQFGYSENEYKSWLSIYNRAMRSNDNKSAPLLP
ncbi:substrate-binding periplasmic protein [Flocculibacter collagenilyticus]|uniref:substrate-binding periplasmic protein n=1 Tax=Flocculibacter collagenilyticus TaxID=2744479 RepID=UPI0018F67A1F|nr:transporter substrate-binding domain-containing protein [Flocculibacter collagenilyticus]